MHVHRLAEMADDPFRAHAAGFVFIRIAPLAVQQLFAVNGHASTADPVVPVP